MTVSGCGTIALLHATPNNADGICHFDLVLHSGHHDLFT